MTDTPTEPAPEAGGTEDGRTSPARNAGPPDRRPPAFRAAAVLVVLVLLCADQVYLPDAAREREVLSAQVAEAVARMDRLLAERRAVQAERDAVAEGGVPPDKRERRSGEPYRSTEHFLFDIDRHLRHLDEDVARVVAQGRGYSRALDAIDANGGRRVPLANRLIAALREALR